MDKIQRRDKQRPRATIHHNRWQTWRVTMRDVKWATKHGLALNYLKHKNGGEAWQCVTKSEKKWSCVTKRQEWHTWEKRPGVRIHYNAWQSDNVKRATKYDLALNQIKRKIIMVAKRANAWQSEIKREKGDHVRWNINKSDRSEKKGQEWLTIHDNTWQREENNQIRVATEQA